MTWFEEPVSSDDLTGLARRSATLCATDVAAGEYGYTSRTSSTCSAAGAVDCLQADVTRCGGITVWLRAAALAEARGLEISGHCAPHLTPTPPRRCPTCATWSGSTTTSASSSLLFDGSPRPGRREHRPRHVGLSAWA